MKKVALIFTLLVIICQNIILPAVHQQVEQTKKACCSAKQHMATEASEPAADVFFPSLLIID